MFLLIPTGTDAPCYYFPFGMIGMIVLNIVVYTVQLAVPEFTEMLFLDFTTWNPIQWLTSSIMHDPFDPFHLIGNMVIFAICGWIVEGKIGWWRFISIYFLIAAVEGFVVQTAMLLLGAEGAALGASGVIFGMICIVLFWAPENEIHFFGFFWIFLYVRTFQFSAAVYVVCFLLLSFEILDAAWGGFAMSSAMLHLVGAIPGAVIGYCMLTWRWVDCEGYDLLNFLNGTTGKKVLTVQEEQERKRIRAEQKVEAENELAVTTEKVDFYISKGHFEMALNRYQLQRRKDKRFQLSEQQMLTIIGGLWKVPEKREKVIPLMESYLDMFATRKVPIALNLAHFVLTQRQQPKKSLQVIQRITSNPMTPQQHQYAKSLVTKAQQLIQQGVIDFVD